ncbi:hypothetical protein, partial [Phascolarctobacterium succinatutens]|uniref:hypothetical protein n=1 Tax=Phascolarctobacterium succinatutens TaxID=626940 RepID=UPI00307974D1
GDLLQAYIKKLLCIFSPIRLLTYPDSVFGKRRERVVFASHSINGFFLRFFHPPIKNIFDYFECILMMLFFVISIMLLKYF